MGLKKKTTTVLSPEPPEEAKSVDELCHLLQSPDADIRRDAAQQLIGEPKAASALMARVPDEADESVIEVLFSAIQSVVDESLVPDIAQCLKSDSAQVRNAAIQLFQLQPQLFAKHVLELLSDEDTDTRIFAVDIIGAIQHHDARSWLHQVIQSDSSINVVGTAIDKLSEIGDVSSLPVLESARTKFADNGYICFAIDTVSKQLVDCANE